MFWSINYKCLVYITAKPSSKVQVYSKLLDYVNLVLWGSLAAGRWLLFLNVRFHKYDKQKYMFSTV